MLRRVRRHELARRCCLVIKYSKDDRYSVSKASTHDKVEHEAVSVIRLEDIPKDTLARADVVIFIEICASMKFYVSTEQKRLLESTKANFSPKSQNLQRNLLSKGDQWNFF